jgi:hypothetical protein
MSKRAQLLFAVVFLFSSTSLFASVEWPPLATGSAYVVRHVDGRVSCEDATPVEALKLNARPGVPLKVFGEDRARIATNAGGGGANLNIILRGTAQLDSNPQAKAAFERAAAIWETRIADSVTVYVDVDFGTTRFGEAFPENVIASASSDTRGGSEGLYPALVPLIGAQADNASESALYALLPGATLPTDLGGTTRLASPSILLRALLALPTTAAESDSAPSIGFNSVFAYDFDPTNGISPGTKDFEGVVVHEIGHMLGFSSRVGSVELGSTINAPTVLDLYRFRPGVGNGTFGSANRIQSSGGEQVFFTGSNSLALSTGRPDGTGGDEQQASHWKDDAQTLTRIGIMDPTLASGVRSELTNADITAFGILGYNMVNATPGTPAPAAPTNLTATVQSSTSVVLNWTDNASNETNYIVERKQAGASYLEYSPLAANATTGTATGLTPGVMYTFRVKARNAAGDSGYSNEASATPSTGGTSCSPNSTTVCLVGGRFRVGIAYRNQFANPPTTGSFVAARLNPAATSPDTALFGFASANDVEVVVRIVDARPFAPRFDIYYGGLTDVEYTVTVTDTVTGQTKTYKNNPGQVGGGVDRSTFPASAFGTDDRMMSSGGHGVFYAGPNELVAGGTPVRVNRVRGSAEVPTPEWTSTPMSLHAAIGGGAACAESEPNETSANADALALGEPCTGNVDDSDPFAITITYDGGDSDKVEDLFKIVLPSAAKVNASLTFTSSGDLDLFLFSISGSTIDVLDISASIAGTSESFTTDETLPAGTYYIGVSAYEGSSSYTVTANGVGLAVGPAAPTGLAATLQTATSARLTWTDNATNETSYIVEVKANSGSYTALEPGPANSNAVTVSGLQAGTTYTFRVKARNAAGDSGYSNEASVTTSGGGPSTCSPNSTTVCLNGNRFRVSIVYRNQFANPPTTGNFVAARLNPAATNPDTALFGFGAATDVEVVVRLVDARPFAPRFDVYYGGLTDVEYTVTVTDTVTGASKTYKNNPGQVGGGVDRSTFPAN